MDKIGRYKIDGLIGEGGFGRAYRATDPETRRTVVIKTLSIESRMDPQEFLAQFREEADTTGALIHQNIATVYEYAEEDGLPYLVVEYLEGRTMEKIIENREPLSLAEKASLMKQVGEAVRYAHSKGVVHRDLRPANVMVLPDGTVKLMDFGIARLMRQRSTRMIQVGRMMDTFGYTSPEQFEGKDVDYLTDIFAFGVIYYHFLTGKHPFRGGKDGNAVAVVIRNVTSVDPPPIATLMPECPPELERIIFKAIQKVRELRYQSFEEIQRDVAPILLRLDAQTSPRRIEPVDALLDEAHREISAGNLPSAVLAADRFFAEAVEAKLNVTYPLAQKIHKIVAAIRDARMPR